MDRVRRYDSQVAVTARSTLDAQKLRADFPIFEQKIHGKPLAYLDSAASSQKPRQVLDALREFYETSYANVHRGVYLLSERATEAYEGAREKVRAFLNAERREEIERTGASTAQDLVAHRKVADDTILRLSQRQNVLASKPPRYSRKIRLRRCSCSNRSHSDSSIASSLCSPRNEGESRRIRASLSPR